jgi:hypothetical protein
MPTLPSLLLPLLQCPVCAGPLNTLRCDACQTRFFSLGGIPCLLPAGELQKNAWQHQLAVMNQQAQAGFEVMQALLERYDAVPATRQRAQESLEVARASNLAINQLLGDAGLQPKFDEQFVQVALGQISEYYHHVLQDWAWPEGIIQQRLQQVLNLGSVPPSANVLALGAGAGRLSWELHQHWNAHLTLATDINPLLLAAGHKLIVQQQGFEFYELNSFPQIGRDLSRAYTLSPPSDPANKRASWFAMAADVWRMPLKPGGFDVILTAWFIDVHGGDNRDLIALIHQWLKPGGLWINSGPLLYPKHTPFDCKYGREELLQLMQVAGFKLENEQLAEHRHLDSPINVRSQTEQVWSFSARAVAPSADPSHSLPQPWLVFHHLPVTQRFQRPEESHPLIDAIIGQVDGKTSVQEICAKVAGHVPEGLDVRETVVAILGELLANVR